MEIAMKPGTLGRPDLVKGVAGFLFSRTRHSAGVILGAHAHENASLLIVLDGAYQETFRGVSETHGPGTFIVKPPGEKHANSFRHRGVICLQLEPDADTLTRIRGHSDIFDEPRRFVDPRAAAAAHLILSELRRADALTALSLEGAALSLVARCTRTRGPSRRNETRLLSQTRALLHELPPGAATLSRIAAELQVHPVHLARAFKRGFGLTVGAYARRLQVDRALELLLNGDRTLAEVAQTAGFYDQSHMTRVLRQQLGSSASEIRKSADRANLVL
jgi:AraC family transcriptional regulator